MKNKLFIKSLLLLVAIIFIIGSACNLYDQKGIYPAGARNEEQYNALDNNWQSVQPNNSKGGTPLWLTFTQGYLPLCTSCNLIVC